MDNEDVKKRARHAALLKNEHAMVDTLASNAKRIQELERAVVELSAALNTVQTRFDLLEQKALAMICQTRGSGPTAGV